MMKKAFLRTKYFVISSVVLAFVSFCTTAQGWSEVYPFYFWKLYSQPAGWAYSYDDLRVYVKKTEVDNWERLANRDRKTFNRDESLYFLRHYVPLLSTEGEVQIDAERKIKAYCKFIAPGCVGYKVVQETYNPLEVLYDKQAYDTLTLMQFSNQYQTKL